MAQDFSPPHGRTVNNAFTSSVYRDVYSAVDPKRPELSQEGKVVMVTGAARGIGVGIAQTFAQANARAIIITARRASTLADTKAQIKKVNPSTEVLPVSLEVTDESSVQKAFEVIAQKYPTIDVLVNNAGSYVSDQQFLAAADTDKWWQDFEVNVKGTMFVTRAFLSQLKPEQKASVIFLTSGAGLVSIPGTSAYGITKLVDMRLSAFLAVENPNVHTVAVHPGIVATEMTLSTDIFAPYAKDTKELAGAVVNWATSEEAGFLRGRYISANWDVTEMVARKDEIVGKNALTVGLGGMPVGKVSELKT